MDITRSVAIERIKALVGRNPLRNEGQSGFQGTLAETKDYIMELCMEEVEEYAPALMTWGAMPTLLEDGEKMTKMTKYKCKRLELVESRRIYRAYTEYENRVAVQLAEKKLRYREARNLGPLIEGGVIVLEHPPIPDEDKKHLTSLDIAKRMYHQLQSLLIGVTDKCYKLTDYGIARAAPVYLASSEWK